MRIGLTSAFVDDQREALAFYCDVLGFEKRRDIPLGEDSWLTVVSPDAPSGPELLLEPASHRAVGPYRRALVEDGIPAAQFEVDDVAAEYARLRAAGVRFVQEPTDLGSLSVAVFDDTCGNLIQIAAEKPVDD
jgi:catechol 2,3-dioxygenase-like lactoylglutathione lyase family enzyme